MTTDSESGAECLFTWSDGRSVLIAERTPEGVALARGWRAHDELRDVRRWRFAAPIPFGGQVRRLVRDATGSDATGVAIAAAAVAWLLAPNAHDEEPSPDSGHATE